MSIFEAVQNLSSFRTCEDREIPREKIGKVLEAGRKGPSPGNVQAIEFMVVESDMRLQMLSDASGDSRIQEAPTAIVLIADVERMARRVGRERCEENCVAEASCAAHNMRLVAREEGLASCWITGLDAHRVGQELKVPDEKRVQGIVSLAYSDDLVDSEDRFGLNEIAFYEEYDNQIDSQFDGFKWKGFKQSEPAAGRRNGNPVERFLRRIGII